MQNLPIKFNVTTYVLTVLFNTFFKAVRVGTYLWTFNVHCETDDETKNDRSLGDDHNPLTSRNVASSNLTRTNESERPTTERISERSNYDNVGSTKLRQTYQTTSNITRDNSRQRRSSPARYDEANV